ncbi:DEAD/DEAH box helicase [Paenibacillus sp. DCT19]|uniref:DEAD/DEAH box helicase n=1 Tax=Paenibacillus sp. DCT19 TaxID=2211212 RepID=UPI000FE21AB7|nr:AAA domain-containing protein [Paenibacillus sp. DCT19]
MNAQDEIYFNQLSKHRAGLANALDDPALRGVKNSVVEKYSDQAHFIYELLQNADDAKATFARFVLCRDKLIFAHNGSRRFSISDPATEEVDSVYNALGDINAITSIANSSKRDQSEASIGKFGVGFKSVFQYTSTPHIYDPNFYFKIERFIVPKIISTDYYDRKESETLFVFPFDHSERSAEEAYEDIFDKLRSLEYPLLFLSHLKDIEFELPNVLGLYGKNIIQTQHFDDTVAERVCLTQNDGEEIYDNNLWLFSREHDHGHTYSVGFFLDEKENLIAKQHPAFCFFLTKESTGLNFIINAPFLLTDSREGIRAGVQHNKDLVKLLGDLAADSLVYLKDVVLGNGHSLINDEIFEIIPYNGNIFSDVNDKRKISFQPFYTAILEKMSSEELLLSSDGFVSKENAYWAFVPQIAELFTNAQLAELSGNEKAKWVFTSFGRQDTLRKNKELTEYIDLITHNWLDEDNIISGWRHERSKTLVGGINNAYIEAQSVMWLHLFYRWVAETSGRTKLVRTKPIFLNQDRKAVAAFDATGHNVLFLPTDTAGYNTVFPDLLENEDTTKFLAHLGIEKPSLRDEIYNHILPLYRDSIKAINTGPHFLKFFEYYRSCTQKEINEFIKLIKDCEFIKYRSSDNDTVYRGKASLLYFPNQLLKIWFQAKPNTKFIKFEEYVQLVGEDSKEELISFLTDLGVKDEPRVLTRVLSNQEANQIRSDWPYSSRDTRWSEKYIDGMKEVVEYLVLNQDASLSVMIWNRLLKYVEYGYYHNSLRSVMRGKYEYFYRTSLMLEFDSSEALRLRTEPWLMNGKGEFVSAGELTLHTLSEQYDRSKDEVVELIQYLGIEKNTVADEDNLTDEQREKIERAEAFFDIPLEELKRFAEQYRNNKKNAPFHLSEGDKPQAPAKESPSSKDDVLNMLEDIIKNFTPDSTGVHEKVASNNNEEKVDSDEDDYTKPSINYGEKIKQAKLRSASEIEKIAVLDELTQKAMNAKKYSFGWFNALLELESLNSGENNANSREISITFSKVELDEGTSRTLILKHPNRYIPQSMEDLADIPLELHFANLPTVKVAVEVVSVKSYTLRAKLRTNAQIEGVDLNLVREAKIEARNPVFLIEELRKGFTKLDFNDDYDMQSNLCDNIEFVFGPPGTGKTTHLAREVILPLMKKPNELKVLVLAPTNKAGDVLTRRLMDCMGSDLSYTDWLVRFGATNDSVIEQSGVFRDKTTDIRSFPRNVTVTTIARFPYDYFLPDTSTRLHLNALKWDYIIIDEASMISLANIIFPLYKKTPERFIIAGDPFQIEPITTSDIWKNENIYTMVQLNSFTEPKTIPHTYPIELLTTQYRSIPEIGEVFSKFAYGGVLKHNRSSKSKRSLPVEKFIDFKPLNIIKFPVSKHESIYRPKRLQSRSNYQIYSALFSFEFIKHLSSAIQSDETFRIGLIAPYRAQSDLIDRLLSSTTLPKNVDVQVGTIHGFQGDECDIIIALFNPPPSISSSKEMFLNKLNIINVSISRAKDYFFVIMPDDVTENVGNLTLIKKVENLIKEQSCWQEHHSSSIEELVFGSSTHIEDNSFSTSHQLVNVYGKPEKRYEVRSEDNAVDVQIHEQD